ncbi:MAG: DUF368 domain-containing protein [Planctomycetes bacterium]|nr:DUF368 domain-containing protein [Planctomycetota bacterium]MCB9910109.1 DUF368 domain-containing protein [Planctomycetota bacterium]
MTDELERNPAPGRTLLGGFLMGFANLVPGISGGTMILAVGLYGRFINTISDVSRLRLRRDSLVFLGLIALGAVVAIGSLSGLLVDLVVEHRWVMYSLFLGMTLGGAPELWKESQPRRGSVFLAMAIGFAIMAAFAFYMTGSQVGTSLGVLVVVGALAASSMILPGISGSYLLLLFGLYETVIGSLRPAAWREDWMGTLRIVAPVGIGAVLGVALLSNALRVFLERKPGIAHGLLLGLLVGSVLGLWPFQNPVHEDLARRDVRKVVVMALAENTPQAIRDQYGAEFTDARIDELRTQYAGKGAGELKAMGDALQRFDPTVRQMLSALGLFALGALITRLVGRWPQAA